MECECKICGWKWQPRIENPKSCPKCKRYDWEKGNDKPVDAPARVEAVKE